MAAEPWRVDTLPAEVDVAELAEDLEQLRRHGLPSQAVIEAWGEVVASARAVAVAFRTKHLEERGQPPMPAGPGLTLALRGLCTAVQVLEEAEASGR